MAQNSLMKMMESTGQVSTAEKPRLEAIDAVNKLVGDFPTDSFSAYISSLLSRIGLLLQGPRPPSTRSRPIARQKYFDSLPSDHPTQSHRSMAAHTNSDLGDLLVGSGQSKKGEIVPRARIHLPSWLQSFQRTWGTSATWRNASGVLLPRSVTLHLNRYRHHARNGELESPPRLTVSHLFSGRRRRGCRPA